MRFSIYQESRQGGRKINEDRTTYSYSRKALLMVIADGMGGHHYGEIAAQIAVQSLAEHFQREARPRLPDPIHFLRCGMRNAHHAIVNYARRQGLGDPPRTTCVACVVQDNIAHWAHAGDSRLYLFRQGRIHRQTRDHSRIRLLLDGGLISEAQAAVHPDRNKIYSCLGGPSLPEISLSAQTPIACGDILLLCTDGLWGVIDGPRMAAALHDTNLLQAIPQLLDQADREGGTHRDNLSVVAARWEDAPLASDDDTVATQTLANPHPGRDLTPCSRPPSSPGPLPEEKIVKAIAETRAAIAKYTLSKP